MKSILFVVFLAIGVSGCSDKEAEENKRKAQLFDAAQAQAQAQVQAQVAAIAKQQKLEECMQAASTKSYNVIEANWRQAGCRDYNVNQMPDNLVDRCNQIAYLAKQTQKDDEDRCVKIYK